MLTSILGKIYDLFGVSFFSKYSKSIARAVVGWFGGMLVGWGFERAIVESWQMATEPILGGLLLMLVHLLLSMINARKTTQK